MSKKKRKNRQSIQIPKQSSPLNELVAKLGGFWGMLLSAIGLFSSGCTVTYFLMVKHIEIEVSNAKREFQIELSEKETEYERNILELGRQNYILTEDIKQLEYELKQCEHGTGKKK